MKHEVIHTDHNGVSVTARIRLWNGKDVEGHRYDVSSGTRLTELHFQDGPVPTAGVNGVTNEALLAVLSHRLRFLDGKFPCAENKAAIEAVDAAAQVLLSRTANRMARGVEGTHAL